MSRLYELRHERGIHVSWVPGVWVLVGLELLLAFYLSSSIPLRFEPFHEGNVVRSELLALARAIALVNVLVVVGLGLQSGSRGTTGQRLFIRRLVCLATASSLLLAPYVLMELGQHWGGQSTIRLERVWERGGDGEYHERNPLESRLRPRLGERS